MNTPYERDLAIAELRFQFFQISEAERKARRNLSIAPLIPFILIGIWTVVTHFGTWFYELNERTQFKLEVSIYSICIVSFMLIVPLTFEWIRAMAETKKEFCRSHPADGLLLGFRDYFP